MKKPSQLPIEAYVTLTGSRDGESWTQNLPRRAAPSVSALMLAGRLWLEQSVLSELSYLVSHEHLTYWLAATSADSFFAMAWSVTT